MSYYYLSNLVLRVPVSPYEMNLQLSKELFNEALFISSPDLHEFLQSQNTSQNENLKVAKLKYQTRMHTRCTPFGLFASTSVMKWGEDTNITIPDLGDFQRHTRLDMHFWGALIKQITQMPVVRQNSNYYPNNSLYTLGDKLRYVEYTYKNNARRYTISAVDNSEYLQAILANATNGLTFNELVLELQSIVDVTAEEAKEFIEEIIKAQLLVSELEPTVTGAEYMGFILPKLRQLNTRIVSPEVSKIIDILTQINERLKKLDSNVSNEIKAYDDIQHVLKTLNVSIDKSKLFQVDMFRSTTNSTLKKTYQKDILKTVSFLEKIPLSKSKTELDNFKEKFYQRYEDLEVPLLAVLDNETGIGYTVSSGDSTPFVDNILLPSNQKEEGKVTWEQWEQYLMTALERCSTQNIDVLKLTDKIFAKPELKSNLSTLLPDTMSVMFSHVAEDKLMFHNVGGSSAGNLLGRFAGGNSQIMEIVKDIADAEERLNPESILAEIVHLPESRTGNILHRPIVRRYEIPYLAQSALPQENQIPVSDLMLSIRNDRIFLRSVKHDKEVLPRLTNAHNYSFNALPVYQFLCDLQTQDNEGGVYFAWGSLENMFSFLPRVEYGHVILSPATWNMRKDSYEHLLKVKDEVLLKEVNEFRSNHKMPQYISISDGDNELMINLEDFWSVKMMVETIKKRESVKLIEFLFDPETAIVKDPSGNVYTNQFIATLIREKVEETTYEFRKQTKNKKLVEAVNQRSFSLGSEWLYYKIYCGHKSADRILAEIIKPLSENLFNDKLINQWFFIRYADPDPHIRVRFKLENIHQLTAVIDRFSNQISQFEAWGLIWKIQTDTYKRELERYGHNSIELAEKLFYYDSVATVNMINMIEGDAGEVIRWKYAIRAVDELLLNFGYSMAARRDLMEGLKTGFGEEFNMNRDLKKQLDKKFREHRVEIEEVMNRENDKSSEILPLLKLLQEKKESEAATIAKILKMKGNNTLSLPLDELLSSFIHMLLNRLFKSKQRLHELVVYDFMYRHYRSAIAREKNLKKTPA